MNRIRHTTLALIVVVLSWVVCPPAHAWNRTGHFIAAAVAYDTLARDRPTRLAQLDALLQAHPAAADWREWELVFPATSPAKLRFTLASVWPDEVRRGAFKAYDRPDWHYVNYPVRAGQPRVDINATSPMTGKAIETLTAQLELLGSADRTAHERAIALSWVLHLVGDLAQPLHVGTLVNADFPSGDRGGNDVFVRGSERVQNPVRLHQIWDDGAGGGSVDLAEAAGRAAQWSEVRVPDVTSIAGLVRLSYQLADEVAYQGGRLKYGRADEALVPVLPEGYTKTVQAVARQQVVVGGRLAARLLN
jgi:hypothetical protein